MIAEPGLTSASSWNSEIISKELYAPFNDGDDDMGFPNFDPDRNKDQLDGGTATAFCSSDCNSSASSDCGYDGDYLIPPPFLLDEHAAVCADTFDWSLIDNAATASLLDEEENNEECIDSSSSYSRSRCSSPVDPLTDNKLWSEMCMQERLQAVEGLSSIISNHMGLREQFDIIRIIEPSANITDTDTEFVIDLESLTDEKLCNVRKYVRHVQKEQRTKLGNESPSSCSSLPLSKVPFGSPERGASSSAASTASIKSEPGVSLVKSCSSAGKGGSNRGKGGTCHGKSGPSLGKGGPHIGKGVSSQGKGKQLKKEAKESVVPLTKEFRQRQKKEQRQHIKERRSGLFEHQQILKLTTFQSDREDMEIDIMD